MTSSKSSKITYRVVENKEDRERTSSMEWKRSKSSIATRWKDWWTWSGSNRRPLPCHGSALPTAPQAHKCDHSILSKPEKIVKPKARAARSKGMRKGFSSGNMELFAGIFVSQVGKAYKLGEHPGKRVSHLRCVMSESASLVECFPGAMRMALWLKGPCGSGIIDIRSLFHGKTFSICYFF